MRTDKDTYFLDMALRCAHQGCCNRRNYGSIIVNDRNHVVATGYTGNVVGDEHCNDIKNCWRKENNIPSGTAYEKCKSVHSEMNALIQSGKESYGAKIYISGYDVETGLEVPGLPCFICSKMIANAVISEIIIKIDGEIVKLNPKSYYLSLKEKIFGEK